MMTILHVKIRTLTKIEHAELQRLARSANWVRSRIDRSGQSKMTTAARQRLCKFGLIERHPTLRRTWRVTTAGRDVLKAEG